MNRKIYFLIIALLIYSSYHFITLTISPLPWCDDTFYASITMSFLEKGTFDLAIAPSLFNFNELLIYGPTYFLATGAMIKLFGFGIFQFRITCLLFGFLTIYSFYLVCTALIKEIWPRVIAVTLLSLDTLMNASMHGGRMDTMALSLMLLAVFFFIKNKKETLINRSILYSGLSGFFAVLAVLTTPRISLVLFTLCFLLFVRWVRGFSRKRLMDMIVWSVVFITLYMCWAMYAFSSIANLINYYYNFPPGFVGGNFEIPIYQIPIIIVALLSVAYSIYYNREKYFSEFIVIALGTIILYYVIVVDAGATSIFIVPFYYILIIFAVIHSCNYTLMKLKKWIIYSLCAFNMSLFLFKTSVLIVSFQERQPDNINAFIAKNIPQNSSVVGDELFYYAVKKAKSDFQYMHLTNSRKELEKYHRNVYNYDYLIWSDRLAGMQPDLISYYSDSSVLTQKAVYNLETKFKVNQILSKLGLKINDSYNCVIYERQKRS